MAHVPLTILRKDIASHFDRVAATGEPLFVTRTGGKPTVVVLSEAAFLTWQEALLKFARAADITAPPGAID